MAACTTTYFEAGRSWKARVAERNAELLAQQAVLRRRVRTPEFYFTKHFDNSRLVKASDPVRVRQMRSFAAAATVLFSLIMIYGLQHFYAIESSYRVESEKQTVEQLREENRQLRDLPRSPFTSVMAPPMTRFSLCIRARYFVNRA